MDMQIIKHTGNMPENFTGVVYNDTGKNNFAAMVNGKWLKRKDSMTRWFATAYAAMSAIEKHVAGE